MLWAPLSNKNIANLIQTVSLIGLISGIIISYRVWFPVQTSFPDLPVFIDAPAMLIQIVGSVIFVLSLLILIISKSAVIKNIALLCIAFFALGDFNRIQPWLYYFLVIIGVTNTISNPKNSIQITACILACVYIMSGIQKINGGFAYTTFPWLVTPLTNLVNSGVNEVIHSLFWMGPTVEILAGVGLLYKKTSRVSALILVLMHAFILLMIGPFGRNTNAVVWPWNLAFSVILILIFLKAKVSTSSFIAQRKHLKATLSVALFFLLLPILSIWDLWPKHLSAALYSGNKVKSEILIPDEIAALLNTNYQAPYNGIEYVAIPSSWSLNELKVALYPSKKAHLMFYKQMCKNYTEYADYFVFTLLPISNYLAGDREKVHYFCSDFN